MVEIPKNTQAFEREPGRDNLDHVRFLCDDFRKPTRCDNLHLRAKLFAESFHHTLHHAHIAEQQTRLHSMDCITTDDGWWPLKIYARKFCGMCKECFCCQVDASRDCTTQIFAILCKSVERSGCPKVDHTRGAAVKIHDSHSIRDPVCANCLWVFIANFNTGLYANINNKRVLFKIFSAGLNYTAGQLRYYRCKADPFQILDRMICVVQKPLKLQA